MSIVSGDLVAYSTASVPADDASTTGGAIDLTARVSLTQFTANAHPAMVSDGADTRNVTVVVRDATGAIVSETQALNGTTEVVFTVTAERILRVTIASGSGTRTVTVKQGSGGSTCCTFPVNHVKRHIQFQDSTSEASTATRYEKQFLKNENGTNALLAAQVTLTADPAADIQIGVAAAVNGTTSIANRKAVPSSVTFVDDGVAQAVPGTNLAAGDAIGVWVQQTLTANQAPTRTTFTLQLSGSTT